MVRWAPLAIPLQRRLQVVAVVLWASMYLISVLLCILCLSYPFLWLPFLCYLTYILNDKAHAVGGRPLPALRKAQVWRHFCDYFPLVLKKEADLDPTKTYIFAYHPHGIIGVGAWGNFATDGSRFSELFPGIDIRFGTLDGNFKVPFLRDFFLSMGLVSVQRDSIKSVLSKPGKAMAIVVGGAAESLDSRPHTHDLTLKNRKGFIRLALETGSQVVPVYCFGENDLYEQWIPNERGTRLRHFQEKMKATLGFTLPLFKGRGIFNYDVGILPNRVRMVTIAGEPIPIPRIERPSDQDVHRYHQLYCDALHRLFDRYKDTYAHTRKSNLRFVD